MSHPSNPKYTGSHHDYENACEIDKQVRAALSLNLSHACIQAKTARSELLLKLSSDVPIEPAVFSSDLVDEESLNPDSCQSRRQILLEEYLQSPNEGISTIWSEIALGIDKALETVETLDSFQLSFQKILRSFCKDKVISLALTKYRLLSRWNSLIMDSEAVNKYGSLMREKLASLTIMFHDFRERNLRLERSQAFMAPDALEYIADFAENEKLLEHMECFYIKLKWICREQQTEIESDVNALLNNPEFHESNASMFLHREDKTIDTDLKSVLCQLKYSGSLDLANAHRIVGEIRSHIEAIIRQIADQTYRAVYDNNESNDAKPVLRKATWLNDLPKCFTIAPSYHDIVQSRTLRASASIDKVLLFENLNIEQQLDANTLETRAADQAKAAIDLLNQDHSNAAARDSNIINDSPPLQKFQALFIAKTALASKTEQKIVRRLNILRSVQRRLVIDAIGGLAMEDPDQLYRHKTGSDLSSDSTGPGSCRPREFVSSLDDFMKFEGIQCRDDVFEPFDEDEDEFRVKDFDDVEIIYDAAIDDWKALKRELLMMGTFFIMKLDAADADEQCGFEAERDPARSGSSILCDRLSVLLDLHLSELQYQSAKCRLVFALLEAYEHAVDKSALNSIAQRIIDVINLRPRIALHESYFKSRYDLEAQVLLLEAEIVSDIAHFQIDLQTPDRNEERRPLFPYGRPVGLFGVCTSTSTIANCLTSMHNCVAQFEDIWKRSHPQATTDTCYVRQIIEMAVLFAIRNSWKQHVFTFRNPLFPLSPLMESLRFDPLYTDVGKVSEGLENTVQRSAQEGDQQLLNEQRIFLSYLRIFTARSRLLRAQLESDLLSSIISWQVQRILNSEDVPNLVGIRPGYCVAQAMGFPVEQMHASCNKEMFNEVSSNGFLSIVSLQQIFCCGLRFLVEYHGNFGQINSSLSKFDSSLFSSSRLISHSSLLSLTEITSSVFERIRWKTSELARLSRSKSEVFTEAISCQPDFLAGCIKTGLQMNGFLLDIVVACERLSSSVHCLLPLGSSPFITISQFKSESKPGDPIVHWLFDLTRGVCLFRDVVIRSTLPPETTHDDIERESRIYPTLYRLCQSAIAAQRLMLSSTDGATPSFGNNQRSDFVMSVLEDVRSRLFTTSADKSLALSRRNTSEVVQECLQNLHCALRLFSRHRSDGIFSRDVDTRFNHSVDDLSRNLCVNNKDAEEEIELHLKRIFYRLNQIGGTENRLLFAQSAEAVVKLYDLIFSLRKFSPENRDSSWVNIIKQVPAAISSPEVRQTFAEIIKHGTAESQRLRQRRPEAFSTLADDKPHLKLAATTHPNPSVPSDMLSSPIVLFLLSQDYGELSRLQTVLKSSALLEMESLDIIEIRLKTQHCYNPLKITESPELLPLREFINGLSTCTTEITPDPNTANDPKQRKRDFWLISKNDLYLYLTRLGRSVVLSKRKMLSDFEQTYATSQNSLGQRLRVLERQKKQVEHQLDETRLKAEWSINRGVIDFQFAIVLESERLKNRESRVKQRINAMEKSIREKVEREYQREIDALKAQLLMKESRFIQYKSELRKQVSSGITDVRRQAMMGIVDSKRVPFQTKRQALQEIRDFTEESIAEQERVDMQRTMLRMKTLFEMKELTLHSRLEAQIRKAQEKSDEANRLFEAFEQSKQREKVLLDQLIDEKNSVKLARDALHQLKHELEGCQRDRRGLLEWKAKSERQITSLKSDIDKYSELKNIDINALVTRLRKSEEALMRLAAEKNSRTTQSESEATLNKRIKQLEHSLQLEQKAKGEAISQTLGLRDRISEFEQRLIESDEQIQTLSTELERERRLNSHLIKESSGLHCLPVYPEDRTRRQSAMNSAEGQSQRPMSCFMKKRAPVPSLQIAAKHAVFTARSRSSAKSRTGSAF